MKYKVGDEVLVKAKIITGVRKYFGVEVEDNRFDVCEDDIIPVPDMTAEEAVKEIKVGDVVDVCGDIGVVTSFGTDGDAIRP